MAKWGEGDPRWIVEERADATNVNNWHWTEKNCFPWSKKRLEELFTTDFEVEDDVHGKARVHKVEVEGECTASNRKAKVIFFWEISLKAHWKGETPEGEKVNGEAKIPNLSEENDYTDIEWEVNTKTNNQFGAALKEVMRKKGLHLCQDRIKTWMKELKQEQSQGMVLPTDKKGDSPAATAKSAANKTTSNSNTINNSNSTARPAQPKTGVKCKDYKGEIHFRCSTGMMFDILTDSGRVQAFTQSPAKIEARVGGKFEMFGGNVVGEFIELVPGKKIVQKWRSQSWPEGHYSTVTMDLDQESDQMKLTMRQTGIPESDYGRTVEGWNSHYWHKIKVIFGMTLM
eukprot:Nk52_evm18s1400 gene=Nk52_evmTU18s1400